jgi:hypothetical protein
MKTIIALLTTTVLVAGATTAMAAEQGSNEAPGYELSLRAAQGFGGAYASARVPGQVHNGTFNIPTQSDFQLQGR